MDTRETLSKTSLFLHWSVALLIISLAIVGFVMVNAEVWSLYPLHKSFGVAATLLIAGRILWRWRNGFPQPLGNESSVANRIARITHIVLLVLTVLMPVSGMMFSAASGHGFSLFGLSIVSPNLDPLNGDDVLPYHAPLADSAQSFHHFLGYFLALLLALHIVAALKHHFIDRDRILSRMLGR